MDAISLADPDAVFGGFGNRQLLDQEVIHVLNIDSVGGLRVGEIKNGLLTPSAADSNVARTAIPSGTIQCQRTVDPVSSRGKDDYIARLCSGERIPCFIGDICGIELNDIFRRRPFSIAAVV